MAEIVEREYERFRAALMEIKEQCGKVCSEYDVCTHVACSSSHRAWEIADRAVKGDEIDRYFSKQEEINEQFLEALRDAISASNELGVIYNPICACGRSIREMFVVEQEDEP